MRWLPLVALILIAGCIGDEAPAAVGETLQDVPTGTVEWQDCEMVEGFFELSQEAAQASLPDGFSPVPLVAGEGGSFLFGSLKCASITLDGAAPSAANVLLVGLIVRPPPEWDAKGVTSHIVLVGSVHTNASLASVFAKWKQGDVRLDELTISSERIADVIVGEARTLGLHLRTEAAADNGGWDQVYARFYAVDDGAVVGAMQIDVTEHEQILGAATLTGSPIFGLDVTTPLNGLGSAGHIGHVNLTWVPREHLATPPADL